MSSIVEYLKRREAERNARVESKKQLMEPDTEKTTGVYEIHGIVPSTTPMTVDMSGPVVMKRDPDYENVIKAIPGFTDDFPAAMQGRNHPFPESLNRLEDFKRIAKHFLTFHTPGTLRTIITDLVVEDL